MKAGDHIVDQISLSDLFSSGVIFCVCRPVVSRADDAMTADAELLSSYSFLQDG